MTAGVNIDAIRRAYGAFEAGDRDALEALVDEVIHPDCGWIPFVTGVEVPQELGVLFEFEDGLIPEAVSA